MLWFYTGLSGGECFQRVTQPSIYTPSSMFCKDFLDPPRIRCARQHFSFKLFCVVTGYFSIRNWNMFQMLKVDDVAKHFVTLCKSSGVCLVSYYLRTFLQINLPSQLTLTCSISVKFSLKKYQLKLTLYKPMSVLYEHNSFLKVDCFVV